MHKLLTLAAMQLADEYTRDKKQISEIDLIETASQAFVKVFTQRVSRKTPVAIFCGSGNNGADGLVIAALLQDSGYRTITVFLVNISKKSSPTYTLALNRLREIKIVEIIDPSAPLKVDAPVVIDAIIGSGIKNALNPKFTSLINLLNTLNKYIIAVDVPTGLPVEGVIADSVAILKADLVITFARPKINFFFPESAPFIKEFIKVDIGLSRSFFHKNESTWHLITKRWAKKMIKPREAFSHKGTYGHTLIVAGSDFYMGAALLAAKGCVRIGTGLTSAVIPETGLVSLNTFIPEVMYVSVDALPNAKHKYTAIGVGPGIGNTKTSVQMLKNVLSFNQALVVDADAINILADHSEMLSQLKAGSILTPHMKEFDRLFGKHDNWWDRVQTAQTMAKKHHWVIVLKNHYTFIALPSGDICINSTGNPAMASGGMGDVLTGIITGFMAQGYLSHEAALLGVYIHGLAGDELANKRAFVSASQVTERLPFTIKHLTERFKGNKCAS